MIKIKDIMTKNIMYYDPEIEGELKKYCKKKRITYLPSLDFKKVYFLPSEASEAFENKEIEESSKISPYFYIFDEGLLKQFQEGEHILFIFNQNLIEGILHFSDYNHIEVYTYLYELIANLERDLRKLLISEKLSNDNMLEFFKKKADKNKVYKVKYCNFKKDGNNSNEVGPFEFFDLLDLIALCNDKKIVTIDQQVNEIRNKVMHSRRGVKNKNYEQDHFIYDFTSFETFFNEGITLQKEFKRIHTRVKIYE